MMDSILALRPFVPAQDFAKSQLFYTALGFRKTMEAPKIAVFKMGSFSFILQDFYRQELAENLMLQLMVRDLDAWWRDAAPAQHAATAGAKPPADPAMQDWGMRVGFVFDPSGVLWHVAEALF